MEPLIFNSSKYAISVDMEQGTAKHGVFAVETFSVETFSRQNELAVTHKMAYIVTYYDKENKKLRCLSPRANYTDRATAACRRS
jgi:hypothetical protein